MREALEVRISDVVRVWVAGRDMDRRQNFVEVHRGRTLRRRA